MVKEENRVKQSETNGFSFEVSEKIEDVRDSKERVEKLENAIKGINEIKFGSLALHKKDGLTSDELAEVRGKLIDTEEREREKLKKEETACVQMILDEAEGL